MITIELEQGSPEWHAHRATHYNASDAPAMMGKSPHENRDALIARLATGIKPEVKPELQKRFDRGHALEAIDRAKLEEEAGDIFVPCVGVLEGTKISASFDGIGFLCGLPWEHKTLNNDLRGLAVDGVIDGKDLPEYIRIQVQHQLLVCGASKSRFSASDETDRVAAWVEADKAMQQSIVDGWAQLERDVAAYVPAAPTVAVVAAPVDALPMLDLRITSAITATNFKDFREAVTARIKAIKTELVTDQDFADAETTAKLLRDAKTRLDAVKEQALSGNASVSEVLQSMDTIGELMRTTALNLEKQVKAAKLAQQQNIAVDARKAYAAHIESLGMAEYAQHFQYPDFAAAMKGKRTIDTCNSAANDALAAGKITANNTAFGILRNVAFFRGNNFGFESDFPDLARLVAKEKGDFENAVMARVTQARIEHDRKAKEAADKAAQDAERVAQAAEAHKDSHKSHTNRTQIAQAESVQAPAPTPIAGAKPKMWTEWEVRGVLDIHFTALETESILADFGATGHIVDGWRVYSAPTISGFFDTLIAHLQARKQAFLQTHTE